MDKPRDFDLIVSTEYALRIKPIIRHNNDLILDDDEFKLMITHLERMVEYIGK